MGLEKEEEVEARLEVDEGGSGEVVGSEGNKMFLWLEQEEKA